MVNVTAFGRPKRLFLQAVPVFILIIMLTGCSMNGKNEDPVQPSSEYTRFNHIFIDIFDTLINIIGYARSQEDFDHLKNLIYDELHHFHILFDGFNEYHRINNIRTINENAGIQPVEVHNDIITILKTGIAFYHETNGAVNIAIGPVTNIWREYIKAAEPRIPDKTTLSAADVLTHIGDVIINEENNTVFLPHAGMSLDTGSIGKGYAVRKAAQKAMDAGFDSFVLSVGGDIYAANGPRNGERNAWRVGILNPRNTGEFVDTILINNTAVFTSGDYLRFFMVDGTRYHHIINPRTLMPADRVSSATVIHPDAVIAEILSLAVFILEIDEAREILANFNAEAIWVLADGTVITTNGYDTFR
ncbi:MAG: FAD:protein FMN transferase [Defluviitaleaceae bacterium]|nr:FAD:protein FMN transferase [Defluviitaleaceae bacterium]